MTIHPTREAQIALLVAKKVNVSAKYLNYADVFLKEIAAELPKRLSINKHAINLKPDKQPPYRPIYSLGLLELEIFKTYIKINLANGFICSSKFSARIPILFVQKLDNSLCLCVDYWGLNNLTIKN